MIGVVVLIVVVVGVVVGVLVVSVDVIELALQDPSSKATRIRKLNDNQITFFIFSSIL